MKCPNYLEPHQIQGLDCIHILPVIQWLLKESYEFGIHIKDYIDMFACYKFDCDHNELCSNRDESLIISRSKEAKKLIKEYFNKNEIKINLEFKIEEFERDLKSLAMLDNKLDEDSELFEKEINLKEQEIESLDAECIEMNKQLIEHQTNEKKQLALDFSRLIDELKQLKLANKSTKN